MDSVRRDLSPFNLTPNRPKKSPVVFGKTKSFDIIKYAPAVARRSKKSAGKMLGLASIWETGCLCNAAGANEESPAVIKTQYFDSVNTDNGEVCYDSDPEDFIRRQSRKTQSTASKFNSIKAALTFSSSKDEEKFGSRENANNTKLNSSPKRSLDDDQSVQQVIQVCFGTQICCSTYFIFSFASCC